MKLKIITILCLISIFATNSYAQDLVPMHNDKGQFGYGIKGSKEFTIKPQWDDAKPFNDQGVAIVRKGKMFGLIDKQGNPIGKSMGYSLIANYDGTDMWLVAEGGNRVDDVQKIKTRASLCPYGFKGSLSYPISGAKWGLVTADGRFQIPPKYQEISSLMENGMIAVQQKNLLGIIDINDNVIYEPLYDAMTPINNQGVAALRNKKTQKWYLIDCKGRTLIGETDNVTGFYQFRKNYWGNLNNISADSLLNNKELWRESDRLMPIMTFSSTWINTEHPYIAAMKSTKQKKKVVNELGVYDINGNEIIPFSAGITYAYVPSDGVAIVYRDNQCGFYDVSAKTFLPVDNRVYLPFQNDRSLSYSHNNNDFYIVDKKGNRISDRYDEVGVADDRYIVKKGQKFGLITKEGNTIIDTDCMEVRDANNGIFAVRDNSGTFGYVDKDGNVVIPFDYADGSNFVNGYAVASKKVSGTMKKLSGVINLKNETVVPLEFEKTVAGISKNGDLSVWVLKDGVFNAYDLKSRRLTPTKYTDMNIATFGTITKNAQGAHGLIVGDEEIIPCSLNDADAVAKLYSFMLENGIPSLTSSQARAFAVRLDPKRNSFKLSDKISENYWDF